MAAAGFYGDAQREVWVGVGGCDGLEACGGAGGDAYGCFGAGGGVFAWVGYGFGGVAWGGGEGSSLGSVEVIVVSYSG